MSYTSISIAAGEMLKLFTINIINDNIIECKETLKLTLSIPFSISSCGAIIGETNTIEVTINDDDGNYD